MNRQEEMPSEVTVVLGAEAMAEFLRRMAREIAEGNPDIENLVMLGILRRGLPLAGRLSRLLGEMTGVTPPVGSLATTLYRDDVGAGALIATPKGETHFSFPLDGRTVLLVDDVLAAGRTIRAAMDEVMDYGRPGRIQLACFIDRGRRELPIQADYLGYSLATQPNEWVSVNLTEIDGEDMVLIERRSPEPEGA